ncbi:alkaline phosphatase family protein [Streptomyces sp. NPDC048001]|uniref:alkaline phosphatase family protein n=1 Tax=Streptomyces sp. NPDC048001 TaxID=3365498 RepID=UPI00371D6140
MPTSGVPRRTVLAATAATAALTATGLASPAARAATAAVPDLPDGTSRDKVLVVGMDGVRHDLIDAADTPRLRAMRAAGTFGASLLYSGPMAATSSGPGWSTISTGVWPDKHGVRDNSFAGRDYGRYPGFLARLHQVRPQLSLFAAVDWKPLDTYGTVTAGADAALVLDGDRDGYVAHDETITATTEAVLRDRNPDVAFVYLGNTDVVAHASGTGSRFLQALAVQDRQLGRMLDAVEARPTRADERWTVIVCTDHGHVDRGGHGGSSIPERMTFVLATGPGIEAGARPHDTRLVDVAATVFHQLGIDPDPSWGLDGRPLQQRSADPFDSLVGSLAGRVDETGIPAGVLGHTHTPPAGWSVADNAMGTGGVAEWRGWSFTTDEFWSRTHRDQWRELNVRSRGVFAVADSDEWDDKANSGRFDSTLVTPAHNVAGASRVTLDYTTHYRQESGQTARVLASFNGGTPSVVREYTADAVSRPESLTLDVPAGASTVAFHFHYTGRNNWYWALDDVRVGAR